MSRRLSKSRFQTGLQCSKALWLKCHAPELADPVPETRQHIFDTGTTVGELARERFSDGVLVAEDYLHSAEALETTARLMQDPPSAIFEAAFQYGGVFVRPDALVRVGDDVWDLYEVKSSTSVKPENISDVAVQTWVLQGCGLAIRNAYLMHLDNTYVYEGGVYDLERLFLAEDVTDEVHGWLPLIPSLVDKMLSMLDGPEPQVSIGKRCDNPYTCAFYGHCHAYLPARPVTQLPRITAELLDSLVSDGILAIDDVPFGYPGLTFAQRTVCSVVRSGKPRIEGDLAGTLSALQYPAYFLDFETFASALPLYAGTRPWQQVPFQWSCHVLHANGDLEHREFLHEGTGDPRPAFAERLIAALGDTGSIVVYTSFENSRLRELSEAFPRLAGPIAAVQARLFDLERVIYRHLQHPDCLGRTSIKVVLPALVDDLSYAGLAIADGGTASLRYGQYAAGQLSPDRYEALFDDLREYCGTDTLAMVRVFEVLQEMAST